MMNKQTSGQSLRHRLSLRYSFGEQTGQAMIEFLFGLVGIVVLIAMLIQIRMISTEETGMVVAMRNDVAEIYRQRSGPAPDAEFLSGWDTGSDGMRYTLDDAPESGDAGTLMNDLEQGMKLGDLQSMLDPHYALNEYVQINNSPAGGLSESMTIFHVSGRTDSIEILPVVRKLVLDIDTLEIAHDIYMPSIQNLMGDGQ